jgi:hypothetical protein
MIATEVSSRRPQALEKALERVVSGLAAKEYNFLASDESPEAMREQLEKFDEGRLGITGKVFGLALGLTDLSGVVKTITKHVVGFGVQEVDGEDLAALRDLMLSSFPLAAVAYSRLYGPRFLAVVAGDDLKREEFVEAIDRFERINLVMMELGGRLTLKLFGRSVLGVNGSSATGSLVVLASSTARANVLREWAAARPLHSDTMLNQMKERFTSLRFWAKAAIGLIEYKPNQLRQEVLVLDAQTGRVTSTASPRLGFEFGFALEDIAAA